jgi:hypothetical protein
MVRRLMSLLAVAAIGWYLASRFLRPKPASLGNDGESSPDAEQQGGVTARITAAASGAAAATRRAAQAPVDRIRSIVGDHGEESPDGERAVAPAGDGEEDAVVEMTGGSSSATGIAPATAATPSQEAGAPPPRGEGARESVTSEDAEAPHIKGNIREDGDKIYHLPGDPAYERTNAEQMFSTIEEAEAAGYRRAGR